MNRDGREGDFGYDNAGRQTEENWVNSSHTIIQSLTWTYDPAGNLATAGDDGSSYTFSYDNANRPTSVASNFTSGPSLTLANVRWHGNRSLLPTAAAAASTSRTTPPPSDSAELFGGGTTATANFTYDNADRLTGIAATTAARPPSPAASPTTTPTARPDHPHQQRRRHAIGVSYTYDAAGRITSYSSAEGTLNYTYDTTNQLTAVAMPAPRATGTMPTATAA